MLVIPGDGDFLIRELGWPMAGIVGGKFRCVVAGMAVEHSRLGECSVEAAPRVLPRLKSPGTRPVDGVETLSFCTGWGGRLRLLLDCAAIRGSSE